MERDPFNAVTGQAPLIDCSANPYDLCPALRAIMDAENIILKSIPPSQKLVIVMGEAHEYQSHQLLQEAILYEHCLQQEQRPGLRFAFGYEEAPDFSGADDHIYPATAPLFDFCAKKNISVGFNDLASEVTYKRDDKGAHPVHFLDYEDPFTGDFIIKHNPNAPLHIDCTSREGMRLRNLAMVEKAMAHIEETQAQIYIQHCGRAHVLGVDSTVANSTPYGESLSFLFKEQGFAVLPVFPLYDWEDESDHIFREVRSYTGPLIIPHGMVKAEKKKIPYADARALIKKASGFDWML